MLRCVDCVTSQKKHKTWFTPRRKLEIRQTETVLTAVKVKCTLVQALRLCTVRTAHRGSRVIALPFLDHGTRRGWGFSVTPWPLPGKTRYALYRRLGGPQGRSGQVRKISPSPVFDPRTVQPIASRYTDYATRPIDYSTLLTFFEFVQCVGWYKWCELHT
jgi:hypothetical protein